MVWPAVDAFHPVSSRGHDDNAYYLVLESAGHLHQAELHTHRAVLRMVVLRTVLTFVSHIAFKKYSESTEKQAPKIHGMVFAGRSL